MSSFGVVFAKDGEEGMGKRIKSIAVHGGEQVKWTERSFSLNDKLEGLTKFCKMFL